MSALKAISNGGERPTPTRMTPPYHSEISEDYLAALQRAVDAGKPAGFELTPIGNSAW